MCKLCYLYIILYIIYYQVKFISVKYCINITMHYDFLKVFKQMTIKCI